MTDAIRVESLIKEFGARSSRAAAAGGVVRALDGVTLGIRPGELFFLLGGSGCGKTTLLRCIAGLETPTAGRVLFDGEEVTNLPTHKREAAMVFQSYALWPHLTVGQNIAFGLEERRVARREIEARVDEALEMVKMIGFEDRAIDQLSGGQQQRVSLARALVVRPKCLLLDEPLSNLDAQLRLEMRSEIRRIVKENKLTAVYVTHDQEEALSMADRLAVMDNGRVEQVGTPREIYREPQTSHVAAFIGETNLLKGTVREEAPPPSFGDYAVSPPRASDGLERDAFEDFALVAPPAGSVEEEGAPAPAFPEREELEARLGPAEDFTMPGARATGDERYVVVDTEAGDFTGRITARNWKPRPGERAIVSLRPEAIRVEQADGESQGRVVETTYLGDVIQYKIETVTGVVVSAAQMNPRVVLEPGERNLSLEVDPQDIVVVRE